ncbi:hypothetical protein TIFTF001_034743 [Ficus carica]|uniref:Uncharacterized protein n=1 Tax=Ficus carica TaxID=3494 RepID=A0AA88J9G1_FICCA|nr:hypothetical protein TIFTF001_034743 [Ficus carica]
MAAPAFGISSLDSEIAFFEQVMKGDWSKILNQYHRDSSTHLEKITWLGDTALHVAVAEGLENTVKSLLQEILETAKIKHDQDPRSEEKRWFQHVLRAKNKDGNTLYTSQRQSGAPLCVGKLHDTITHWLFLLQKVVRWPDCSALSNLRTILQ